MVAEVAAEGGAGLDDAALDGRVAGAGEAHDLLMAVAGALRIERLALREPEDLQRPEPLAVLKVIKCLGGGTAVPDIDRLPEAPGGLVISPRPWDSKQKRNYVVLALPQCARCRCLNQVGRRLLLDDDQARTVRLLLSGGEAAIRLER